MQRRVVFSSVIALVALHLVVSPHPARAAATETDVAEQVIALSLDAGRHDRGGGPVAVLVDETTARNVMTQLADGTLGRASLLAPGLLHADQRGQGKRELHFGVPHMAAGESREIKALLFDEPIGHHTYVWTGEPRRSRRLSCGQCHQGRSLPTADELWEEWRVLEETGKVPPRESCEPLPTSKGNGRDFRWHEKLNRYQSSACWQCHGRHMVQYEFGQSLDPLLPWAPDLPHGRYAESCEHRSVYHKVFRTKGDRIFARRSPLADGRASSVLPCGIHYGFQRATLDRGAPDRSPTANQPAADHSDQVPTVPCSDILQQHVSILSEEAGKFIGRHNVLIDWIGHTGQTTAAESSPSGGRTAGREIIIAREERQLTVKNMGGRNGGFALWIDFVSQLTPAGDPLRFDGATPTAGFRFVVPVDVGTTPEYRESAHWKAITFVSEAMTYTAVCFNSPANPRPLVDAATRGTPAQGRPGETGIGPGVGYRFSAQLDRRHPLLVHYRLWIQGDRMSSDDIQAMSNDFIEPVKIEMN